MPPERDAVLLRLLLDRHRGGDATRAGDLSTVSVKYYRKFGLPGRRWAAGPSLQKNASKEDRRAILSNDPDSSQDAGFVIIEVDIENCIPALMWIELLDRVGEDDHDSLADFNIVELAVKHHRIWKDILSEYLGIPPVRG